MGYDMYVRGAAKDAEHGYLRRNIFGMHPTVEAMVSVGMAFWSPSPGWPKVPQPYEDHVRWDDKVEDEVPVTAEGQAYLERVESARSTHGETRTPGIPSHKFTSNDGWHVTREECEQALAAYDQAVTAGGADHPKYLMDDVLPFLRCAAQHDGFEVH